MNNYLSAIGRVLLAHIFLLAGLNKLGAGYAGTQGYMDAMGVPGGLLPLVILLEIGGGLALLLGWKTRIVSLALAGFTALAAILFHGNVAEQMQMIMFMKNLSITGGLLFVAAAVANPYSLDDYLKKR